MSKIRTTMTGALAAAVAVSLLATAPAEARRGGSFGSRGYRTYSAPRPTPTTPGYTAPVQRSMTPPPANNPNAPRPGYQSTNPSYQPGQQGALAPRRPGFGTGLAAGLIGGGLLGAMMGHGWGGGWGAGMGAAGGLFSTLFQLLLIGGLIWLAFRLFRRRSEPALAGGPFGAAYDTGPQSNAGPWGAPLGGAFGGGAPAPGGVAYPSPSDEIAVSSADRAAFERLLGEVQDAFAREDYGALRERTTPEVMSYLAEELSQNATHGRRNDVGGLRLLQSDVSEAWSEGDADYATVAMRYESTDVMRDRQTGQVLEGDPGRPTQTTELWTFVRRSGGPWQVSAIQET
jgi:predicted lipid-binding transport protein (Tim44 family)